MAPMRVTYSTYNGIHHFSLNNRKADSLKYRHVLTGARQRQSAQYDDPRRGENCSHTGSYLITVKPILSNTATAWGELR
jgi:hypothetical protein